MTEVRFTDVIDAIDALVAEEVQPEPAPVRFSPSPLTVEDVDEFIDQCLQRGSASGEMPSTIRMSPAPEPVIAPSAPAPAPRRRRAATPRTAPTREVAPRPNRYAATCTDCGGDVPAGAGVLTARRRGRWLVSHVTCPTQAVEPVTPRRSTRSTRPATTERVEPARRPDCYVVTVEIEVDATGVTSPREAALLALREVFKGEVPVTVTASNEDDGVEVTL